MLTFLFWNFKSKRPDQVAIAALAAIRHEADVLVLAESTVDPEVLLEELKRSGLVYHLPGVQHDRFQIYTKFPGEQLEPYRDDDRINIRKLRIPGRQEVLFGAIHFFDRIHNDRRAQHSKALSVMQTLREAERDAGHSRTVVVGDFNMNPFEDGMIDPHVGFGAMMSRELARRHSDPDDRKPQRFYNPMWSRLVRQTPEPGGTHYWNNVGDPFNIFWYTLDQVIIRPSLFDAFPEQEIRVLTETPVPGGESLALIRDTGKHWRLEVSDHLPILFKLDPAVEVTHD